MGKRAAPGQTWRGVVRLGRYRTFGVEDTGVRAAARVREANAMGRFNQGALPEGTNGMRWKANDEHA